MYYKILVVGIILSFILPGIFLGKATRSPNIKSFLFRMAAIYFMSYLVLGVVIRFVPALINPY